MCFPPEMCTLAGLWLDFQGKTSAKQNETGIKWKVVMDEMKLCCCIEFVRHGDENEPEMWRTKTSQINLLFVYIPHILIKPSTSNFLHFLKFETLVHFLNLDSYSLCECGTSFLFYFFIVSPTEAISCRTLTFKKHFACLRKRRSSCIYVKVLKPHLLFTGNEFTTPARAFKIIDFKC